MVQSVEEEGAVTHVNPLNLPLHPITRAYRDGRLTFGELAELLGTGVSKRGDIEALRRSFATLPAGEDTSNMLAMCDHQATLLEMLRDDYGLDEQAPYSTGMLAADRIRWELAGGMASGEPHWLTVDDQRRAAAHDDMRRWQEERLNEPKWTNPPHWLTSLEHPDGPDDPDDPEDPDQSK